MLVKYDANTGFTYSDNLGEELLLLALPGIGTAVVVLLLTLPLLCCYTSKVYQRSPVICAQVLLLTMLAVVCAASLILNERITRDINDANREWRIVVSSANSTVPRVTAIGFEVVALATQVSNRVERFELDTREITRQLGKVNSTLDDFADVPKTLVDTLDTSDQVVHGNDIRRWATLVIVSATMAMFVLLLALPGKWTRLRTLVRAVTLVVVLALWLLVAVYLPLKPVTDDSCVALRKFVASNRDVTARFNITSESTFRSILTQQVEIQASGTAKGILETCINPDMRVGRQQSIATVARNACNGLQPTLDEPVEALQAFIDGQRGIDRSLHSLCEEAPRSIRLGTLALISTASIATLSFLLHLI